MEHARDEVLLDWLRRADEHTSWTTSVCSGSIILGAAGLLTGKRATSHWAALPVLRTMGVTPVGDERIVHEGKVVTAAGVSAGIDLGLWLAGQIAGPDKAKVIQLAMEYDPQPPFDSGHMSEGIGRHQGLRDGADGQGDGHPDPGQSRHGAPVDQRHRHRPPPPRPPLTYHVRYRLAGDQPRIRRSRGWRSCAVHRGSRGAGRTWHLFQIPAFQRAGYRCITFDNRGIGKTENAEGFTLSTMVGDTASIIEQVVGGPVRVVAVSMGSYIAQELMLARPELVSQAVLMATRGRLDRTRTFFLDAENKMTASGVRPPVEYDAKIRLLEGFSPRSLNNDKFVGDWIDMFTMWPIKATPGLHAQTNVAPTDNRLTAYRGITKPTMVVGFADDVVVPPIWAPRWPRPSRTRPISRSRTPATSDSSRSPMPSTTQSCNSSHPSACDRLDG
jgi:pimeloyl-ACP methyl ester carboxylesterase